MTGQEPDGYNIRFPHQRTAMTHRKYGKNTPLGDKILDAVKVRLARKFTENPDAWWTIQGLCDAAEVENIDAGARAFRRLRYEKDGGFAIVTVDLRHIAPNLFMYYLDTSPDAPPPYKEDSHIYLDPQEGVDGTDRTGSDRRKPLKTLEYAETYCKRKNDAKVWLMVTILPRKEKQKRERSTQKQTRSKAPKMRLPDESSRG